MELVKGCQKLVRLSWRDTVAATWASTTWSLTDSGVLTISGTGDMADYYDGDMESHYYYQHNDLPPWADYSDDVSQVVLSSGVTSVGYGAGFEGLSALLTMINSCANGVSVVNIDNGYGAGYIATQINRLAVGEK